MEIQVIQRDRVYITNVLHFQNVLIQKSQYIFSKFNKTCS